MTRWLACAASVALLGAVSPTHAFADWDAKQLKEVRAASVSLRAAIATAERDLKGKAYFAIALVSPEAVTYTVKVDAGDKSIEAEIDSKTGKIIASSAVTGDSAVGAKEFGRLKGGLLAAIKAAESTAKGKSFTAAYKHVGNKDFFEINIAGRDDVEKDVIVDAATGKIRKVEEKSSETGSAVPGAVQ